MNEVSGICFSLSLAQVGTTEHDSHRPSEVQAGIPKIAITGCYQFIAGEKGLRMVPFG